MGESREHRLARTEADMNLFSELPSDYDKFVEYHVFMRSHRIIFNNDTSEAYCTACKTTHKISELKKKGIQMAQKKKVICPCCQRYSVAYNSKYYNHTEDDVKWSIYIETNEDKLLINYVRSIKDYLDYKNPKIKTMVIGRTVIDIITKQHCYERDNYAGEWHNYRKYLYPKGIYAEPFHPVLYNDNLADLIKGTPFEYSALNIIADYNKLVSEDDGMYVYEKPIMKDAYMIEGYIETWREHKYYEKLLKCGLFRLFDDLTHSWRRENLINEKGNNIAEILKLSKGAYKLFAKGSASSHSLRNYQIVEQAGVTINEKVSMRIEVDAQCIDINENMFKTLIKYTSAESILRYMGKSNYNFYDYPDYISMAETLGYNLKDKYIRFPNDIKKAHDVAVGEFNRSKKNKTNIKLKNLIKEGLYNFEYEGICIVVPKCTGEIIKEGQAQHHCVGTYVDQVCKGSTMILFVRNINDKGKPFYTMEFCEGKIVQCRGFKNGAMTEEVKKFNEAFQEEMNKRLSVNKAV